MKIDITHRMAAGLWQHLSDLYCTDLVDRRSGDLVEPVRWVLDLMGIRDHDMFLRDHSLSLIDTIYTPFVPGEVCSAWPPASQVAVAIHEHHHCLQAEARGAMMFAAGYLLRKDTRASHEAEALRTNLEFHYWLTGQVPDPEPFAREMLQYGCGAREVWSILAYLQYAAPAIEAGEVISESVRAATEWLQKNVHAANG